MDLSNITDTIATALETTKDISRTLNRVQFVPADVHNLISDLKGLEPALAKWIRLSNTNDESIIGWNLEVVKSSAEACAADIGNIQKRVCEIVGNDIIIWKYVPGSPKLDDIRKMAGTVQYHTQSIKKLNFQMLARLVAPKTEFTMLNVLLFVPMQIYY
jgi:hypothetical protein